MEFNLPIFDSFNDFGKTYQINFQLWKYNYPDGEELNYLKELENLYKWFIDEDGNFIGKISISTIKQIERDRKFENYDVSVFELARIIGQRLLFTLSVESEKFSEKRKIEYLNSFIGKELSEMDEILIEYDLANDLFDFDEVKSRFDDGYYIIPATIRIYKRFMKIERNELFNDNFTVKADGVKYKNFEYSVHQILNFIYKKKTEININQLTYNTLLDFKQNYITDYATVSGMVNFLKFLKELSEKYSKLYLRQPLSDEEFIKRIELSEYIQKMLPHDFYFSLSTLIENGVGKTEIDKMIKDGITYKDLKKKFISKSEILKIIKEEFSYINISQFDGKIEEYLDIKLKERDLGKMYNKEEFEKIYFFIEKLIKEEENRLVVESNVNSEVNQKENPLNNDSEIEIFKCIEAEKLFFEYADKYILDSYTDFSFIYQQMKSSKLIERLTHFEFADWLLLREIITEKDYSKIVDNRGFKSLDKSTSAKRLNDYFNLEQKYLNKDFRQSEK